MRWWPTWLTVNRSPDVRDAARAERVAKEKLRQVPAHEREVRHAVNRFADEVEAALSRRRYPS